MSQSPSRETLPMQLTLPHPWHTTYTIKVGAYDEGLRQFQVQPTNSTTKPGHQQLHKEDLFWTEPKSSSPNTAPDGSSQESIPVSRIFWETNRPSIGQAWLAAYGLITLYPSTDAFHITLQGDKSASVANELCRVGLLAKSPSTRTTADHFLFRGSFWQGVGSPFGPRPVWLAADRSRQQNNSEWEYPPLPLLQQSTSPDDQTTTTTTPSTDALSTPLRPPKPRPGTTIYTRPIPSLPGAPSLTLAVLDPTNTSHISAISSWAPYGTPDAHESHLLANTRDASVLAVLAYLGDATTATPLAYFELYWLIDRVADEQGLHYPAGPHDRGIGNVLFAPGTGTGTGARAKGVKGLLWGAAVHYAFLDEPRTGAVYGAPRYTRWWEGMCFLGCVRL
ncbi:putative lysine N-acyltransferase [Diplodia seriata]|uniref:Putative lysine N-acyltransferase n=1 Tax=Diplodia seriata TaxID=420778 RepID=A0A1S8BCQ9_9PEZI|nr:putative lysine N-acyltransferase [Diplodia seriata]